MKRLKALWLAVLLVWSALPAFSQAVHDGRWVGGDYTALIQSLLDTKIILKEGPLTNENILEFQENDGDLGWVFASPLNLEAGRAVVHRLKGWGDQAENNLQLGHVNVMDRTAAGTQLAVATNHTFSPTSGSAGFVDLQLSPTVNQTGGASGPSHGLLVKPTLTSAADFTGIEVTNVGTTQVALQTGTGDVDLGGPVAPVRSATEPVNCSSAYYGFTYFDTSDTRLCICVADGTDDEWVKSDDYTHATGHCSI